MDDLEWVGFSNDDKTAMTAYFKGCAFEQKKNAKEARKWLGVAAGMGGLKRLKLDARRAIPYANALLGEMALQEGDVSAAAKYLKSAKNFTAKYMFAEMLSFRLKCDFEVLELKKNAKKK